MKRKLIKIILAICMMLLSLYPLQIIMADSGYARIIRPLSYLYKSANSEIKDNVICYLEETYFVQITLDYSPEFYKVIYNDVSGYVSKNSVSNIIGTPSKPYPTANITTIDSKCYLRSTPTTADDNIVTVVPENCSDLKYIGKIYGEEAIDYQGNLWYYVSYFGVNGYVYSHYIYNISNIAINSETFDTISSGIKNPTPLSIPECGIIIAVLTLPALIIIILMFKPLRPAKNKSKSSRKIVKQTKIDYDELL
ncbi:MAG: SH3 domain-containing protein [Clostridiales bacterium]|nr:SH3 domain-containing protein [Clostridiales bacterium]